ncbi:MAG: viroplasmin family protein [Lachnospiraceae bacterium]
MAKYNYYAVLRGRKPGIYRTYAECQKQTVGFSNAAFKGFLSEEEARTWMENGGSQMQADVKKTSDWEHFDLQTFFQEDHLDTNELPPKMPENYAFVDGSYNEDDHGEKVYGYGGLVHVNGVEETVSGHGNEETFIVSRQIPGEAFGSLSAIEKAIEMGAEHIVIFFDYAGIGHWATSGKRWKAEKPIAKEYVRRFDELSQKIKVNFYHVKAHTNIAGNELVDKLAKKEVGLL